MSKLETISLNYYTLVNIQRDVTYSNSIWQEECHGLHTFVDQDEVSNEINKVVIKVLGKEIDITSRLTKGEIELLGKLDTDEVEIDE